MKLSIVMMIKNEAKHLGKCLMSIKPIQAAIDAEIIIVDTGSEDSSPEIARRYTDKVYFHQWNNDFAAMRNITISYATGEWIFVLDGDEVIENPEEFINFFQSESSKKYNTGIIRIKNYTTENEDISTSAMLQRLFRNEKDFKYTGAIHEQPHGKPPMYYFKSSILHYGYISTDPELMERKFVRNTQILKSELEKDPKNIYYWFQLAQSYETYGNHEEALEANLMAYEIAKQEKRLANNMYIYVHLARVNFTNNRFEELESMCIEAIALKDGYIDLYFMLAMAQQQLAKNNEAIKNYNQYLDMHSHYEDFPGSKDMSITTFTLDLYEEAYANLCILYFKEKLYEKAMECIGKLNAEHLLRLAMPFIIKTHIKLKMYMELKHYYDTKILIDNGNLSGFFIDNLEAVIPTLNKQDKSLITESFSKGEDLYSLLNILRKENKLNKVDIEKLKEEDFNKLPVYFSEVLYYLLKNDYFNTDDLYKLSDRTLESYFIYLIARYKRECAEFMLQYIWGVAEVETLDNVRIRKTLRKVLLLSGMFHGERYEEIFKQYIKNGLYYLDQIYNKDIIAYERIYDMRNEEDIFLLYMLHADKSKGKDSKAYISYLKKALNAYPEMVKGIEFEMKNNENFKENVNNDPNELEAYKRRFKETIQSLIGNESPENIKAMIEEYEKIVADDIDIYSIKAVIAMMEGDAKVAEALLLKGLSIDVANFDLLYNLAYLYQSQGQTELAADYYKKALLNAKTDEDSDTVYGLLQELGVQENKQELLKNKVPSTSIVILTYNNLEYNKSCIESIRKFTERGTYEIVVVDNKSTDGTVNWLKKQKDLKLVLNDENMGFPKGCNQGILAAKEGNDILLLNNDTIVTPNWLSNLKKCLYSDEAIGAVGAVTNSCSYYQAISANYKDIDGMLKFAEKFNISDSNKWEQRIKLVGYCMLIKRSVLNKIGLLDERFSPGNYEDDDLSFRIQMAGYRLMLCNDTFIHHFGSLSFNKNTGDYVNLLSKNSDKFKEKWGFRSDYSCFIRTEIIRLIDEPKDKPMNVLEIGCACGATLVKIKDLYKNANLYGIELDAAAAKIAENYADVRAENIENASLSYDEEYFDYIIFADVLEHLYDPWKVINNMKRYLKPNGKILASIPNIMHASVVRGLLNGSWSYQDAGILDKTHIRFFTLHEIDRMFKNAGYADLEYSRNVMPLSEEDEKFISGLTSLSSKDLKQQFEAYQYIVKAVKHSSVIRKEAEKLTVFNKADIANLLSDSSKQTKDERGLLTALIRRLENNLEVEENLGKLIDIVTKNPSYLKDAGVINNIRSLLNNAKLAEQKVGLAKLETLIGRDK